MTWGRKRRGGVRRGEGMTEREERRALTESKRKERPRGGEGRKTERRRRRRRQDGRERKEEKERQEGKEKRRDRERERGGGYLNVGLGNLFGIVAGHQHLCVSNAGERERGIENPGQSQH